MTRPAADDCPVGQSDARTDFTGSCQSEATCIECEASQREVLSVLADPTRIPEWAPAFADRVIADARSGWRATKDDRDFALRVAVDEAAGTVEYLRELAPGREGGAHIRTVPRPGGGSLIAMTLPVLAGNDPTETAATLTQELEALVVLLPTKPAPPMGSEA